MNKALVILILILVLGGGYVLLNSQKTQKPADSTMSISGATGVSEQRVEPSSGSTGAMMDPGVEKEFTLDSFEFGYDQKTLTVKKGDTVTLTLTNSGKMMHDWILDEFNAKTKQIKAGETDSITFVADQAGTFEYYCSVGQHRANGMAGKLIVE